MTYRTPFILFGVALVGGTLALSGASDAQSRGMGHGAVFDFDTLDRDGSGSITREDLDAARTDMVAGIDADGDGLISAEEIAAFHMRGAQERADAMAARMIEALDADGDGMLSAAELLVRPMSARMTQRMFDRIDADGDGTVTREEWDNARAAMQERRREVRQDRRGRGGWDGHRPRRERQAD